MNIKVPFRDLSQRFQRRPANNRVVFTHWDRETIDYMIVTPNSQQLELSDVGSAPRADHANPLKALAEYFEERKLKVGGLVALLSRPEMDQLQLDLPPAEALELPSLVASAVEAQLGESDVPPIVDFLTPATMTGQPLPVDSTRVLAFALSQHESEILQSQCESAGFRLAGIGSRHLSPLGVLKRRTFGRNTLTVSIHVYSAEVELVICRQADPLLLRSIRINPDEPARVAEQIWLETQRGLTLLPDGPHTEDIAWCVFTTSEFSWQVAQALEDRGLGVQTIDPLLGWDVPSRNSEPTADGNGNEHSGSSAANAGAAWSYVHGGLPVDLLNPKKAPAPPNPYIRWGALGGAATLVLAIGVGFLLADVQALQTQAADLQQQLADAKKITAKYQAKADQVAYVESWLADQVDWLQELEQLSQRLPQGQNATVRRLTGGTIDRTAVFDLSVQVAEQGNISELEHGFRSAKYATSSKSINQKADESEYPWQFETRITFAIDPPDPKNYAPPTVEEPQVEKTSDSTDNRVAGEKRR